MNITNNTVINILPSDLPITSPSKLQWEALLANKSMYILNEWLIANPENSIRTIEKLQQLATTNRSIQEWYSDTSKKYNAYRSMPDWAIGDSLIMKNWAYNTDTLVHAYKKSIKSIEDERVTLTKQFKDNVKSLNDRLYASRKEFIESNPLYAISFMSVDNLPKDLAIKAFNTDPVKYKTNLSEALKAYKCRLAHDYINKRITVAELVEILK